MPGGSRPDKAVINFVAKAWDQEVVPGTIPHSYYRIMIKASLTWETNYVPGTYQYLASAGL